MSAGATVRTYYGGPPVARRDARVDRADGGVPRMWRPMSAMAELAASPPAVDPAALQAIACTIRYVWTEWTDNDLASLAELAAETIDRLADRIHSGE